MKEHPVVGPLLSAHIIERAFLATLKEWLPGYLTIACELNDIPEGIEKIKSWGLESELPEDWPSQGTPSLLVISGDTIGEDPEDNGGTIGATWRCDVVVTVKAGTGPKARRYAQTYGAAIRGALLQRRSLGEEGQLVRWLGERPGVSVRSAEDPESSECSVLNAFAVDREDIVSWRRGPGDHNPIPDTWPIVNETAIETEIKDP